MFYFQRFILLCLLVCTKLFGQTGPGGVGSSSNNKLWLDANKGITLSGSNVTNWADQSGNSFNAVPNGSSARPTLVSSSINGYPSLDFDGTNDELWVEDNAALDLTQWHFFFVGMVDNAKDYNAWITKGNDGTENYEMLSYSTNNIHSPTYYTDATRTFPSTASAQVTSTANIIEYSYSSSVGRDLYKNGTSIGTDNENKTPSTNSFSLYIGNEKTTSRFLDGDLAEIIIYNAPLNSAQRIIVNNYLAAKYNCTLTANDLYDEDNAANGNYDHDVAGIGRVNSSNVHNDSRGSGIVRILNPTGLDDNEYYIWGHDNGGLGTFGVSDFPASQGLQGRLGRVWRGSETGAITDFEVRFDLTGLGSVTASQLRLLIDTDNDGTFADETTAGGGVVGSAVTLGSNVYGFTNITAMNNNIRFTLGTTSVASTPLPVELVEFNARAEGEKVRLNWTTASEKNSDYFTIERSKNGVDFEVVGKVSGAMNSKTFTEYSETDNQPYQGVSYYRLKQTDTDRSVFYSSTIVVNNQFVKEMMSMYPNPSSGEVNVCFNGPENSKLLVSMIDASGKVYETFEIMAGEHDGFNPGRSEKKLPPGVYFVKGTSGSQQTVQKLIVK